NLPDEVEMLGGIVTGAMNQTDWLGTGVPADFYAVKGIAESIFEKLGVIEEMNFRQTEGFKEMHPGRTADILLGDERIGFAGELHPKYASDHDLGRTAVFEINLDRLLSVKQGSIVYETLVKYPSITRDIALTVEQSVTADELISVIHHANAN